MANPVITADEVGRLYDEASRMSNIFNEGHEHLGYWYDDEDGASAIEAGERLTRKVAGALGLRPDEHLLDAGCGIGAPGVQVAKETGARVTGITVSRAEAADAERRVHAEDLVGQVRFQHGDYQSMPFGDGTFDAVMAIESLTHAPDLPRVLAEFHRVLRPGGRLALSECTRGLSLSGDDLANIPDQYKTNLLLTIPEWIAALEAAGFFVEEYTQCGPRVFGMGLRYLDRANDIHDTLVEHFGEDAVQALKQGYRDMFGRSRTTLGYAIVCARKPAVPLAEA